ncbi:DUF1077-domain-containing protein [Pterulicium gracile]|uniref:ER membrane protein complex subunit 4 n=1 Tax=Pterulicium gracile TaxID=1884261 RepID=A0A5C3QIA5_9AGAR|nr:DUF1077-domain-containing protein [Pterula gracilis]
MSTTTLDYASLESSSKYRSLPPPPGFSKSQTSKSHRGTTSTLTPEAYDQLKEKRAWDFAAAPVKSLPMQGFMLYMSGGGVQIFSMGIVFMLLLTPFKNIFAINQAFQPFAPTKAASPTSFSVLTLQKLAYIAANLLTLAVGLWKCRSMGLLPLGTGDWLEFETRGRAPEILL